MNTLVFSVDIDLPGRIILGESEMAEQYFIGGGENSSYIKRGRMTFFGIF